MFVAWVPTREGTAGVRDHVAAGHREVEFDAAPELRPGLVVEKDFGPSPWRLEVQGGAVLAVRGPVRRRAHFSSGYVPPLTFAGELDPHGQLVRGAFAIDVDTSNRRWATVVQLDLWHLALLMVNKAAGRWSA